MATPTDDDEEATSGVGASVSSPNFYSYTINPKAYSFASVTAAMYLLVATAIPDLRSGFALLVDGSSGRHRVFGLTLLGVFGLMIAAAMELLNSDAEDDVSIITNSVSVLFVADVDEKALTFFLTVPQEWRLFWAMNVISLSVSLALIFVVPVGDVSAPPFRVVYIGLWDAWDGTMEFVPSWFVFVLNPAALTYIAYFVSKGLQVILGARGGGATSTQGAEVARRPKAWRLMPWEGLSSTARAVRKEICFYFILLVWFVGVIIGPSFHLANAALAVGLAMFAARRVLERKERTDVSLPTERLGPQRMSGIGLKSPVQECIGIDERKTATDGEDNKDRYDGDDDDDEDKRRGTDKNHDLSSQNSPTSTAPAVRGEGERSIRGRRHRSRVPSLLVGWGLGFWASFVLVELTRAWDNGDSGAPVYIAVLGYVGYVIVPLVLFAGVFMIADAKFLGAGLEPFLKRPVRVLKDSSGWVYWTMSTLLRNTLFVWFLYGEVTLANLNVF